MSNLSVSEYCIVSECTFTGEHTSVCTAVCVQKRCVCVCARTSVMHAQGQTWVCPCVCACACMQDHLEVCVSLHVCIPVHHKCEVCMCWTDMFLLSCIAAFRSPSHMGGLNHLASISQADRADHLTFSGSNSQLNSPANPQYIPDFGVRALSDLQYAKVSVFVDNNFISF